MAIRRKIGNKYYLVRERDSLKGKKGTIISRWSNKTAGTSTKTSSLTKKKTIAAKTTKTTKIQPKMNTKTAKSSSTMKTKMMKPTIKKTKL